MNRIKGQTALVLILLTAAALIFLAITLNWGRIAQTKALISIAADEAASLLASDTASYGEMQKQTYLRNTNQVVEHTGVFAAIFGVLIAIIAVILAPFTGGSSLYFIVLAVAALAMAVVNLVLQVVVIQPGITSLWNALQKNQSNTEQFYEQGIVTALENAVTDQVLVTDYLDSNANGKYGATGNIPNDFVSRFALFYTDRLKMLNGPPIPQVAFFDEQLEELLNGETCAQNQKDNSLYPGAIPLNPACTVANLGVNCSTAPIDPVCQQKIPGGFQLNDVCTGSNPSNTATYSPYCDPCCQLLNMPDPLYCPAGSTTCTPSALHPNPTISIRPSNCSPDTSAYGAPAQCAINNPYYSTTSPYPTLLYDSSFQNYLSGVSFLAQFGRDQQMGPFSTSLSPQGSAANGLYFPSGIYPFFWLMKDYDSEVDNINPTAGLLPSQAHWCMAGGAIPSSGAAPVGYADLAQLNLANSSGYTCQGPDCCVNYLSNSVVNVGGVATPSGGGTTNGMIDMVGSPTFGPNPALDPSFGEGGTGTWVEGDDQMCSVATGSSPYGWPYNGSTTGGSLDGTCDLGYTPASAPDPITAPGPNATVDNLDDTMHSLTDFLNFSNTLLTHDAGTLSSSFKTWYPQIAPWITSGSGQCEDGSSCSSNQCTDGSYCSSQAGSLYNAEANFSAWEGVIANWLNYNYANSGAWCVPPTGDPSMYYNGNSTSENTYITNSSGTPTQGDLAHVIACLNYNSGAQVYNGATQTGSVYNYQQCLSFLTNSCPASSCDDGSTCTGGLCADNTSCTVPSLAGTVCDPSILGRSLAGPAPAFNGSCDITQPNSYAKWVSDSYNLANDEAPKFALRSAFLTDVYNRAKTMRSAFQEGYNALSSFLAPCSGANCSNGGPAAQLSYAYSQPLPSSSLPYSVIYGWVDNPSSNGHPGSAHIVKVTVYAVGRSGNNIPLGVTNILPWVQTKTSGFLSTTRSYTLVSRDGPVYVGVKRWDQDHDTVNFPNGHALWQFLFHNPNGGTSNTGSGIASSCLGAYAGSSLNIGIGFEPQTVAGLQYSNISPADQNALASAFMLNDNVNGTVDPNSTTSAYASCLSAANQLLVNAPESHACAYYLADIGGNSPSQNGDNDYSVKFFPCSEQPDDLTAGEGGLN